MNLRILQTRQAPEALRQLWQRFRGPAPAVTVKRQQIPYWQERGWTRSGNRYAGNYQTPWGAFQGYAEQHGSSFFRFYILHPPVQLSRDRHWTCFIFRGGGTYEIHLSRQPADVGSGILAIERLLAEAFQQARG
jgi:hypothetical protein